MEAPSFCPALQLPWGVPGEAPGAPLVLSQVGTGRLQGWGGAAAPRQVAGCCCAGCWDTGRRWWRHLLLSLRVSCWDEVHTAKAGGSRWGRGAQQRGRAPPFLSRMLCAQRVESLGGKSKPSLGILQVQASILAVPTISPMWGANGIPQGLRGAAMRKLKPRVWVNPPAAGPSLKSPGSRGAPREPGSVGLEGFL